MLSRCMYDRSRDEVRFETDLHVRARVALAAD